MLPTRIIFQFWLTYLAGMVALGWGLSLIGKYEWMGWSSCLVIAGAAVIAKHQWRETTDTDRAALVADLRYLPVPLLLVLIALAGSLYPTAVLDSLSYRIPRMQFWLQEGGLQNITSPDFRMNMMTPVWEFASTPLYQLSGLRFLWLGSAISWILLYLTLVNLASLAGASANVARHVAIIPAASVGFVLQASSTMNDLWAAALLSISLVMILAFERTRDFSAIICSGLALALAANAKPHYAVLALPWVVWFFLSANRPLLAVRWKWVAPLALIGLLSSPLPTFLSNHDLYGSIKGPAGDSGFALGSPATNITLGSVMMAWQIYQPPINPAARKIEAINDSWIESTGIRAKAPRFSLSARELLTVDNASIGLISALALSAGLILAWRSSSRLPKWTLFATAAGLFGYLVGVSQVVPGTLGRSFLGFTILVFPLCMIGLSKLRHHWLLCAAWLSVFTSVAAIVFSPSHPLWPVKTLAKFVPQAADRLASYIAFQERGFAGIPLLKKIPDEVRNVGVLATGDQSLVNLWRIPGRKPNIHFFPACTTIDDLVKSGIHYFVIIGDSQPEGTGHFGTLPKIIQNHPKFTVEARDTYTTMLRRGPEEWLIVRAKAGG